MSTERTNPSKRSPPGSRNRIAQRYRRIEPGFHVPSEPALNHEHATSAGFSTTDHSTYSFARSCGPIQHPACHGRRISDSCTGPSRWGARSSACSPVRQYPDAPSKGLVQFIEHLPSYQRPARLFTPTSSPLAVPADVADGFAMILGSETPYRNTSRRK